MPAPHKFTRSELEQYYHRIGLPASARIFDVSSLEPQGQLAYLTLLQKHNLVKVPFENLALHYSWHRVIDVDPQHLFEKIVRQPGRGGYCMENNSFFHVVLSTLGFDVYMVPSRVRDQDIGSFLGLTHCLNVVTIGDTRYAVDVAYGANGPCRPCMVESELAQDHILPAQMRVRYGILPGASARAGNVWFYEHRTDENAAWIPMYCFVDTEILPADVRSMNWSPWQSPTTIFRKTVLCVIFTTEGQVEENGELRGNGMSSESSSEEGQVKGDIDGVVIILGNNIKWRRKGEKKIDKVFKNDRERLDALEKYFGIFLSRQDQDAIKGTVTEVPTT